MYIGGLPSSLAFVYRVTEINSCLVWSNVCLLPCGELCKGLVYALSPV